MTATIPQQQRTVWRPAAIGTVYQRVRMAQATLGGRFKFSVALLLAIVVFAFLGPTLFDKHDPTRIVGLLYDPPSSTAWLGTDNFGYDVFAQLMHGTRTSLIIGVVAGAIATGIGVTIGTIAGFRGD